MRERGAKFETEVEDGGLLLVMGLVTCIALKFWAHYGLTLGLFWPLEESLSLNMS